MCAPLANVQSQRTSVLFKTILTTNNKAHKQSRTVQDL